MADRTARPENSEFADDRGNVFDIEGDHVEENPVPDPRDRMGTEPAAGYMGGGVGGIATSGFDTTADYEDNELRSTSESGTHGSVAESADLGQRPLRDYKREGNDAMDAPVTTMSADQSSTGPVDSYVSDADAVDRPTTGAGRVESRAVAGGNRASSGGTGRTILDTSNDRFDETSVSRGSATEGETDRVTGAVDSSRRTTTVRTETTDRNDTGESGRDSMSLDNDNTSPLGDISTSETLDNVQTGFKVIDANGDEIGKVRDLKAGDTSAATVDEASESTGDTGVFAIPGGTGTGGAGNLGAGGGIPAVVGVNGDGDRGEPNVAEPAYTRLTRTGFIRIDSSGWFSSDRYAGADQIDRVDGETIYLRVGKDDLISER